MISILRWILLPISLIYQSIVWLRNKAYDKNILKSQKFAVPTIVIGNLAIGGAGKSPMTELIIKHFSNNLSLATLSRGYGRKTKGFKFVTQHSTVAEVGDEPLQFKKKFPAVTVSVCEDRCVGIKKLAPDHQLILLDDAYQHRKLSAGYYILLFDFYSLFECFLTLPTGNFRDNFSSVRRADVIVITKAPHEITAQQKEHIERKIRKYTTVPIFYSTIQYESPYTADGKQSSLKLKNLDIILFCGIANPKPLIDYLAALGNNITLIRYPDHHDFSNQDSNDIKNKFNNLQSDNKVIITTEKDIQRIEKSIFEQYPLYYIPISTKINQTNTNITLASLVESYVNKTGFVNQH